LLNGKEHSEKDFHKKVAKLQQKQSASKSTMELVKRLWDRRDELHALGEYFGDADLFRDAANALIIANDRLNEQDNE